MLDRIESLENELRDVEIRLGDPSVQSDPRQLADLGRRFKQLEAVVAVAQRLRLSGARNRRSCVVQSRRVVRAVPCSGAVRYHGMSRVLRCG